MIGVFLLPVYTTHLNGFDFGAWGLILTYTGLLAGIKDLGLTQLVTNVFFQRKQQYQKLWNVYYGWLVVWSVIFAVVQALILWFSLHFLSSEDRLLIILLYTIMSVLIDPYVLFVFRYYQFNSKFNVISVNALISSIASVAVSYYLIVVVKLGFKGLLWGLFISQVITFIHYFICTAYSQLKLKPAFVYKPKLFYNSLRIGLPIIPHNYSAFLLNASDRIVMDKMKVPVSDIGVYSVGYTIGSISDAIGAAITLVLSPTYLKLISEKKFLLVKQMSFYLQYIFLFFTVVVCIWMKEIFPLLVRNPELQEGYKIAFIVLLSFAFRPFYVLPVNALGYFGKTRSLWKITFVGSMLNVILTIILISMYGYFMAAVATFISLFFIAIVGYYLKDFKDHFEENYQIPRWSVIMLVTSVASFLLLEADYLVKIGISLIALLIVIINVIRLDKMNKKFALF